MQIIPIKDVPSQTLNVQLAGQSCRLLIYQRAPGLFMDVYVSDALIIAGVLCENLNRIVRDVYLGFIGDLAWLDNDGADNPEVGGLGGRFQLCYLTPDEVDQLPFTKYVPEPPPRKPSGGALIAESMDVADEVDATYIPPTPPPPVEGVVLLLELQFVA
jgi:hypothetical protein